MIPDRMTNRPSHYHTRSDDGLSRREREVIALIARGHTNAEIASELGLAFDTVKSHVSAILSKLGVDSREEAVVRWTYERSLRARLDRARAWTAALLGSKAAAAAVAAAALAVVVIAGVAIALSFRSTDVPPEPQQLAPPPPLFEVGGAVILPQAVDAFPLVLGGSLWTSTEQGVAVIDLSTGGAEYLPGTHVGAVNSNVELAGGMVWAVSDDGRSLVAFDPATRSKVASIALALDRALDNAWLLGTEDKLYVSWWAGDRVMRFDLATGEADGTLELYRPKGPALAGGSLWVPLGRTDQIARVDPATMQVEAIIELDIPVDEHSFVQAVIATPNDIWAMSEYTQRFISRVEVATNKFQGAIELPRAGGSGVAVDDEGYLWVASRPDGETRGELLRIDPRNSAGVSLAVDRISIDPPRDPLDRITPRSVRIDGDTVWVLTEEREAFPVRRVP